MVTDVAEPDLRVPVELDEMLDAGWLERALAPLSDGRPIAWLSDFDNFETVAAKVRFAVRFEGSDETHRLCLKAMPNTPMARLGGATAIREARYYRDIAPHVSVRSPRAIGVIDAEAGRAALVMEDLIAAGATFCSAKDAFTPDQAAASLDQIARLHAAAHLLDSNDWIPARLPHLAANPHLSVEALQTLMDGPRCATLDERTSSATMLLDGMKRLAARFAGGRLTLGHGDCHAGNFYRTADGEPGLADWQLIHRGNWAQDVAYHVNAVLPPEVAAAEERRLVGHYLDRVRAHGGTPPASVDAAWDDYRAAQIYGYYHWAITRMVEPAIVDIFCARLGAGVERHGTYKLLGL